MSDAEKLKILQDALELIGYKWVEPVFLRVGNEYLTGEEIVARDALNKIGFKRNE